MHPLWGTKEVPASSEIEYASDLALKHVIASVVDDKLYVWNSIELFDQYQEYGGCELSRPQLIDNLRNHFAGELLVLSSPGYANIVAFHNQAATLLKMVKDDDDCDINSSVAKVAKEVTKDCKAITLDRTKYRLNVNEATTGESVSSTLHTLLAAISPKLDNTLPALMIGNVVTSILKSQPTDLQVSLGVLLRDSKMILGYTYDFGITCSYDEVLRFKKSAAVAAAKDPNLHGISDSENGLVQTIVDNFDADIHSPNGKLSTHSLAMILTQPSGILNESESDDTIARLKHDDMSIPIDDHNDEISQIHYVGQKHPPMPEVLQPTLSEIFSKCQSVSQNRATGIDFQFLLDLYSSADCPEYNGYNTKLCREQGHTLKPKTKVVYLPLIDKTPADPSTIMTAMAKAIQVTNNTGQRYVVFTADLQLYKIAVQVLWENPVPFRNVYLRLGGMHLLMSYIGSIGNLMADSGIVEVLSSAFGGVLKMLIGKKFPENVRVLRMLVEELLRPVFARHQLNCMDDLKKVLEDASLQSRTAKLWVNCLIYPVFTIMKYVRAEREADWPLHLATVKEMVPLFFAAGHVHYARYGLFYLRSMEAMPEEVRTHFMKGQHTMHHNAGLFNGIWSDMAIETTFMRYGHGQSGIIGITLRPETLKTWAYSIHACNKLVHGLDLMRSQEPHSSQTHHKEEMKGRVKLDCKDRKTLQDKLQICIDPLHHGQHPEELVNIVTGKVVGHPAVNVHNAIPIGIQQMEAFEESWPTGFYDTIHNTVKTMALTRRHLKVANTKVYDTEMIYARAMGLQNSVRNFDTKTLMAHELSPVPTSMFDESGHMKDAKTKSNLKNALKVEISGRHANIDVSFLDGCAILWVVPWPSSGTVQNFLNNFRNHIKDRLRKSELYLIFDRYNEGSIKESTRSDRDKGASRVYTLAPRSPLPPQKVVLTVSNNKKQLIDFIMEDLISHKDVFTAKLVITGNDPTPVEIDSGLVIRRQDLAVTHEEADTIIIQQIAAIAPARVLVVADDTDVFILLCHFVFHGDIPGHVMMESPIRGRAIIDINGSVENNQDVMSNLLAAHGITGCDTVSPCYGIGKGVALKELKSHQHSLSKVGEINSSLQDALQQASQFMLSCYGHPECDSMTEARQKIWSIKVSRSLGGAPKLQTLPPTNEAFRENVARAHLQVAIWRHALEPNPPHLDPLSYGWIKDEGSTSLVPRTVAENVALAPDAILKMIKCSCDSDIPCKTKRCGCYNANMPCTEFCACQGGQGCFNERTRECYNEEHGSGD